MWKFEELLFPFSPDIFARMCASIISVQSIIFLTFNPVKKKMVRNFLLINFKINSLQFWKMPITTTVHYNHLLLSALNRSWRSSGSIGKSCKITLLMQLSKVRTTLAFRFSLIFESICLAVILWILHRPMSIKEQ